MRPKRKKKLPLLDGNHPLLRPASAEQFLVGYGRVSDDEQERHNNIERQFYTLSGMLKGGLVKEYGGPYTLLSKASDPNESDPKKIFFFDENFNMECLDPEAEGDREFFTIMNLIKNGRCHAILADSIDRIFRAENPEIRGTLIKLMTDYRIKLIFPNATIDSKFMLELLAAWGAEDKRATCRKLHIGKLVRTKNTGSPPNGFFPFGLTYESEENGQGWKLVPEEATAIRWTVAMTQGKLLPDMPESLRVLTDQYPNGVPDQSIRKGLTEAGVNLVNFYKRNGFKKFLKKNPNGKLPALWVQARFAMDCYTGEITNYFKDDHLIGKGNVTREFKTPIKRKVPQIVSHYEWAAALKARRTRACYHGKGVKREYLLRRLLECTTCHKKLEAKTKSKEKYVVSEGKPKVYYTKFYDCKSSNRNGSPTCPDKRYVNAKNIEPLVWNEVKRYIQDPSFILQNEKINRQDVYENEVIEKLQTEIDQHEQKLHDLEVEKSTLIRHLGKAVISEKDFLSSKNQIDEEIEMIKAFIQRLQSEIAAKQRLTSSEERIDIAALRERYGSKLDGLVFKERQELVSTVVETVLVHGKNQFEIKFKRPVN